MSPRSGVAVTPRTRAPVKCSKIALYVFESAWWHSSMTIRSNSSARNRARRPGRHMDCTEPTTTMYGMTPSIPPRVSSSAFSSPASMPVERRILSMACSRSSPRCASTRTRSPRMTALSASAAKRIVLPVPVGIWTRQERKPRANVASTASTAAFW